ncbi:hypothetical protein [Chitinophaga rhizosphaerae]|uniref:hypothetical protein n=1 Tax=Chitinophaga rhizosphaerae TaxID=1864947 RepID=UPI000F7FBDA6|nr:hypothetical protein [Chitinophaga rhizosphaerae]
MRNREKVSIGGMILLVLVIANALILRTALTTDAGWYRALYISLPLLLIVLIGMFRKPGAKP